MSQESLFEITDEIISEDKVSNENEEQRTSKKILTEAHREILIEKARKMKLDQKIQSEKSIELNKRLFDYLKLKGITPREKTDDQSTLKYNELLERFYKIFNKNEKMNEKISDGFKKELRSIDEMRGLKNKLFDEIFQTGIVIKTDRKSLNKTFLNKVFDRFVRSHTKVSAARKNFIVAQDTLLELREKGQNLNDIGDGLKAFDFDNIETEIQTISSNIANRIEKLDVVRKRLQNEENKFINARMNRDDVLDLIEEQSEEYENTKEEEKHLRSNIKQLKTQKIDLRKEFNELSEKSGILLRIPLMKSFDVVTDEIRELKEEISSIDLVQEKLSDEAPSLQLKIEKLAKKDSGLKQLEHLIQQEKEKRCIQKKLI